MEEKYIIANCFLLGRSAICHRDYSDFCKEIPASKCLCKEIYEWAVKYNEQSTAEQFEVIKESEIIEVW